MASPILLSGLRSWRPMDYPLLNHYTYLNVFGRAQYLARNFPSCHADPACLTIPLQHLHSRSVCWDPLFEYHSVLEPYLSIASQCSEESDSSHGNFVTFNFASLPRPASKSSYVLLRPIPGTTAYPHFFSMLHREKMSSSQSLQEKEAKSQHNAFLSMFSNVGCKAPRGSYFALYRPLKKWQDKFILASGIVLALAAGAPLPIIGVIFSRIINTFPPDANQIKQRIVELIIVGTPPTSPLNVSIPS